MTLRLLGTAAAAVSSVAGKVGAVTLAKADVGLSNVDNTADASKPVSTAQQTALNGKATAPASWQALTLTAAVTQASGYDTVGARLEGDVVRLRGQAIASGAYAGGGTIFTLPAGLWPTNPKRLGARTQTGANTLNVNTDGTVNFAGAITGTNWAALDGLAFTL